MSDDKKGHVRPDSDGRWLVYAEGVEGAAYVYDVRMKDGHPTNAQTGGILAGGPGDQWYRCYVPGLDKPQNDIELLRDLYFKHRHEIADLRAERDEARQEVERLTRENQRLTDMAGAAQSQLGYWGVKVYPNDIARGIADLAQERDKCRLDAQSESLINEELRAELATLRQQQGKGEGDGEKVTQAAEPQTADDVALDMVRHITNTPAVASALWSYLPFLLSVAMEAKRREASRAT